MLIRLARHVAPHHSASAAARSRRRCSSACCCRSASALSDSPKSPRPQASFAAARVPAAGATSDDCALVKWMLRASLPYGAGSPGGRPLSSGAPISFVPSSFFFPSCCSRSGAALVGRAAAAWAPTPSLFLGLSDDSKKSQGLL
jgi:hypothetical protein